MVLVTPAVVADDAPRRGWWNRANVGLLPTFGPPDVASDQLLVEGVSGTEDGWTAVAGLAFVLDGTVDDATLTLVAASAAPQSTPPVACPLSAGFSPVAGGPWSDVPAHDCGDAVPGEVTPDGARVLFRGLGPLAASGELRLLIAPGGAGRYVFHAPGAGSLDASGPTSPSSTDDPAPLPDAGPLDFSTVAVPPPEVPLTSDLLVTSPQPSDAPTAVHEAAVPAPAQNFEPARQFQPVGDDGPSRRATAAALALVLFAFIAMQRGAGTRLRPARVAWRRD